MFVNIYQNSELCFKKQRENGYLIEGYFGQNPKDCKLKRIIDFFVFLANVYDVRNIQDWKQKFETMTKIEFFSQEGEKMMYLNKPDDSLNK